MAEGNSSSSVAIVAIMILVLAVGAFLFVYGGRFIGGETKTVNVDLNVPKPAAPAPQG
jgi:hypothetical protein